MTSSWYTLIWPPVILSLSPTTICVVFMLNWGWVSNVSSGGYHPHKKNTMMSVLDGAVFDTAQPQNRNFIGALVILSCIHFWPIDLTVLWLNYSLAPDPQQPWYCGYRINVSFIDEINIMRTHNLNITSPLCCNMSDFTTNVCVHVSTYRAASWFASTQWETALLCNDVSHWLATSLWSALYMYHGKSR